MKTNTIKKQTGVVVPLGALYTKDNPVIGEFPDLAKFAQFCKKAGLEIIQLLPVNDSGTQSSPYSGLSAFALHPIYIRIKDIPEFADLYKTNPKFKKNYDAFVKNNPYKLRYDYDGIANTKIALLKEVYDSSTVGTEGKPDEALAKWIKANPWCRTYAVYKNLKWNYMQASWKSWHENDQHKTEEEILELWNTKAFKKEHLFYTWIQMIAFTQFEKSVAEVRKLGIKLKGDMPILMNEDSCDTWAFPQFFNQDLKAGSPVDGENPTGQNWGFPTYNWKNLKGNDYSWWKDRLKVAEKFYDAYRLDHILGFFRIWAIPSSDANAMTGHTEPYSFAKREDLYALGFDDNRIRWLSLPHIPTKAVEDVTWNHDLAHSILSILCVKLENEELWQFKKTVKGSADIYNANFKELCNEDAENRIKQVLVDYWSNRTLLEVAKNKFVPLWTYYNSTSWKSLNQAEQGSLQNLFNQINGNNDKLWRKQSDDILHNLTSSVNMIPCGEDLGVNIECVPQIMEKNNILGLRVVRWCRKWAENGQPYVHFADYSPLSVATTSVHDSSTTRQWWMEEKDSVKAFIHENAQYFGIDGNNWGEIDRISYSDFTPEYAYSFMKACSKAASLWYISPLQDYLYMNKKYWLNNAADERINIPGTVTNFNWTYRLPVELDDLCRDSDLISKIQSISDRK